MSHIISHRARIQWRPDQSKLAVKQLAYELGVSTRYVYAMRANGFDMEWDQVSHCYVATLGRARRWIKRTSFRLSQGKVRDYG